MSFDPDIEELLGPPTGNDVAPSAPPRRGPTDSAVVGGAFDAAGRFDRTMALWTPPIISADQEVLGGKIASDVRSRDLFNNDGFVQSGVQMHKDSIIGTHYVLNAKPNHVLLRLDETWAEEFQLEVEEKFTAWAESPNCWVDASRHNGLTEMLRLALGVFVFSGEVLATVEWLRDRDRYYNTAIQMVDTDRLGLPPGYVEGRYMRSGVEINDYGVPQFYHIRMAHPTDYTDVNSYFFKRVPARKPWGRIQVIHLFEQRRVDQHRGISQMVAALKEMHITRRFRDIVLQNAVVNATYAATIESELPTEAVYAALGGGNLDDIGKSIQHYAEGYLSSIAKYAGNSKNLALDGVRIPHLYPGTKLNLQPASSGGPLGTEFEQSMLRYISAALGVSYEQLSHDYSQTNYSSARAGANEAWKYMMGKKKVIADRFANHVYMLWLEEAINKGDITSLPLNAPSWYEGLNAEAYSQAEWIGAARGQIDELKETQAAVLRLRNNLSTYEQEIARMGGDWRKTFAQAERERRVMQERGIVLEQNEDMMNAVTGEPRSPDDAEEQTDV